MAKILNKTLKIDLSNFFNNEEAFVTICYIPRETWRHINRLTLKTAEALFYSEIINNKEIKELQKKIEIEKNNDIKLTLLKKLEDKQNELLSQKYCEIEKEKLSESYLIESEKNKLLIEYGLLKDNNHNLTDEKNNLLILTYDLLKNCNFFDYLINKIIEFNSNFDALERTTNR